MGGQLKRALLLQLPLVLECSFPSHCQALLLSLMHLSTTIQLK